MTRIPSFWLRLLHAERGALLWVPALWAAAAVVLFGMVQSSMERTFYNHTRDLRLALGPLDLQTERHADGQAFTMALRQGLAEKRELTLVGDDVVQRRVAALLGAPLPAEPQRWMRATRNLNVSVYLTARLREADGLLQASVALWNVGSEAQFARFAASGKAAPSLGRALADSVGQALFSPQTALHASR
jgi:hypothetical protein